MFGLTFLNSVFLAGLTAAVLPIVIHLFSRRRAREVAFPSLEYLRELSRQKVRRMRLRQWILLALRVLILALFALAMGRPALRGSAGVVTRGSSTLAILLDNSFSMAAADPRLAGEPPADVPASSPSDTGGEPSGSAEVAGSLFHAAKERALETLDLMGEGDRGILALTGRPVSFPFQTPVADAGLLRQEVRRAPLVADRSDLPAALAQVLPALTSARTMNKELFIISDFQRRDLDEWIRAAAGGPRTLASADSTRGPGPITIPEGVRIYLVPVREGMEENASIERLRFDAASGRGGAGRVVATVLNQGDDPITDRVARASGAGPGGALLADALFSLPPHGRAEVPLDLSALPPDGALEVRIGSDLLEWDNRAFLVTGDPGVPKVLLVTGGETAIAAPGTGALPGVAEEGQFLHTALDPAGNAEFFRVRQTNPAGLADPSTWDADVVILSNVGRLSEGAVESLGRFRSRGGGILIGLGDRIDPRYYNTDILGKLSSIQLLSIAKEEGSGTYRSLRPTVLAHPVFTGFPIGPGDDLGSARFREVVSCRIGPGARVLAEFGRDIPALIEEDGLLLFASSLDGQWNDFVTSASFPPLLHQIVRYLASRGATEQRSGLVGSRLETLIPEDASQGPFHCLDPAEGQTPVEESPLEHMVRLRSQPALQPGIYRFADAAGKTTASFAVNLDTKEGDLAVSSPEVQGRLFGREARRLEPGKQITRDLLAGRYGRELWRPLLVMVLILLAVESLLGRGRLLG